MDMSRVLVPRVQSLPITLARRSLDRQPTGGDVWRAKGFESRATFDRVHVGESIVVQGPPAVPPTRAAVVGLARVGWSNYGLGEQQPPGETKGHGGLALSTKLFGLSFEEVDATAPANKRRGESFMMSIVEGGSGSDGQVLRSRRRRGKKDALRIRLSEG